MLGLGISSALKGKRNLQSGSDAPNQAELVYHLDGTIIGDQLIDAKNGYNFTINNKDFDSDTYGGVPFKSIATISAPASGAAKTAVLAIDNGFWYDATDTPREIPIISFFQNIDFGNQLFCRHTERVVNADLEEVTPPLVTDICGYSAAQTIDSTMTDYFGSDITRPTSNVLFVSKDGDDGTGDGSWATPYLTVQNAWNNSVDGNEIYVLGGIYDETTLLTFNTNKGATVIGAGFNTITSTGTTSVVYFDAGQVTLRHFILDAEDDTTNLIAMVADASQDVTFDKCKLIGSTSRTVDAIGAPVLTFNNCVSIDPNEIEANGTFVLTGTYITSYIDTGTSILTFTYNKFESVSSAFNINLRTNAEVDIRYNKFTHQDIAIGGSKDSGLLFKIERNKFYSKAGGTAFRPIAVVNGAGSTTNTCTPTIKYNYFQCDHETVAVINIDSEQFVDAEIDYNVIICNHASTNFRGIQPGITMNSSAVKIRYNRIFTEAPAGYGINLGETGGDIFTGAEIVGNYIRGHLYNTPANTGQSLHGIAASRGTNMNISYNRVEYVPLGIVVKGGATAYTSQGVYSNIVWNCENAFYIRQTGGLKIYNNTFALGSFTNGRFGAFDSEDGNTLDNITLTNNLFVAGSLSNMAFSIEKDALDNDRVLFDDNVFDIGAGDFIRDFEGTPNNYTYAQSVTNGWVTNGEEATVTFEDLATGDLRLSTGSAGLGDGTTLAAAYDDGLDGTTDWNDDETDTDPDNYPAIVTKQQGANWDKGAYVH